MPTSGQNPVITEAPQPLAAPFSDSLKTLISKDFSAIPEVLGVSVQYENGEVLVSIKANRPEKALRYRIYARQLALMGAFPEVDFDFNLVQAE